MLPHLHIDKICSHAARESYILVSDDPLCLFNLLPFLCDGWRVVPGVINVGHHVFGCLGLEQLAASKFLGGLFLRRNCSLWTLWRVNAYVQAFSDFALLPPLKLNFLHDPLLLNFCVFLG